jgi:regulator of ribonuclease activity A
VRDQRESRKYHAYAFCSNTIFKALLKMSTNTTTVPLSFIPTCDLYDQYLDQARIPSIVDWKSYGGMQQFCGVAVTVQCGMNNDNSRVRELLQTPGHNRVLVVQATQQQQQQHCAVVAVLGDALAEFAYKNQWSGIVVYGNVRDVAALSTVPIGIMALGATPRASIKQGTGQANVTVQIGDVAVDTGDFVFADNDGVVFLDPKMFSG